MCTCYAADNYAIVTRDDRTAAKSDQPERNWWTKLATLVLKGKKIHVHCKIIMIALTDLSHTPTNNVRVDKNTRNVWQRLMQYFKFQINYKKVVGEQDLDLQLLSTF